MFTNIINYESNHTQSAYEVELRVRAREEQRFMLEDDLSKEANGQVKSTGNPGKADLAGIFSILVITLLALAGALSG